VRVRTHPSLKVQGSAEIESALRGLAAKSVGKVLLSQGRPLRLEAQHKVVMFLFAFSSVFSVSPW